MKNDKIRVKTQYGIDVIEKMDTYNIYLNKKLYTRSVREDELKHMIKCALIINKQDLRVIQDNAHKSDIYLIF